MNLLGHTEINAVGAALCGGPLPAAPDADQHGRPRRAAPTDLCGQHAKKTPCTAEQEPALRGVSSLFNDC